MLMVYLPLVIARWIHFACVFVLFGSSFFWLYERQERLSAGPGGLPRTLRATTILLRIAAPIAAISGVAWLALVLINMTHDFDSAVDPEDLQLFFFETPFGPVSIVRLTLLAIAVVIAFLPWHGRWRFAALASGQRPAFDYPSLVWPFRRWQRALSSHYDHGLCHPCARRGRLGGRASAASFRARRATPLRVFARSSRVHARHLLPLFLDGDDGGHIGCFKRHCKHSVSCRRIIPQAFRQRLWRCAA